MEHEFGEYITATKTVTYSVEGLIDMIRLQLGDDKYVPTKEEIIDCMKSVCEDEFSCGSGHTVDTRDIFLIDDHGNYLD